MAAAGGDCIGLDWRLPLDEGWDAVGADRAVQGNLDPAVLLGPWPRIEAAAATSSPAPAAVPATSSTSATACFRRPIRTTCAGSSSSSRSGLKQCLTRVV